MDVTISAPRLGVRIWSWEGVEYSGEATNTFHEDILSIDTDKQIGSPAGQWSVTLTSRRDTFGRTWAKRIRPQDYVEIYGSRTALPGAQQTIIMRGFVDNVMEDIAVAENGQVQRIVRINGRDFGKVLLTRQMVYSQEINPLALLLPAVFTLTQRLGLGDGNFLITPTEFLGRIKEILLNDPTIGATQPNPRVPKLQAYTDILDDHRVNFLNLTPATGSVWTVLESFAGGPWNELFLRDDDNFPRLYWRLAPLHNKGGKVQHANAKTDVTVTISLADIIAEHVGTGVNEIYCAFLALPTFLDQAQFQGWIEAMYLTTTSDARGGGDLEAALDPFNVHAAPVSVVAANPILRTDIFNRYGFKVLNQPYPLFPFPDIAPDQRGEAAKLALWLHNIYSWNPMQESGSLVIKGNPNVRIGQHIMIKEQNREFYVEGVSHKLSIWPTPEFTTNLSVTRGLWLKNNPYPEGDWL